MKIALVCFNLSWQTGGPRVLFAQAKAMEKLGHDVVIYAPEFEGKYFTELWRGLDIRVVPLPAQLLWNYASENLWFRIRQKIKQEKLQVLIAKTIAGAMDPDFDVVNAHDFGYKIFPFYKKKNPKAKLVWTMHDTMGEYVPKGKFVYDVLGRMFNAFKRARERTYYKHSRAVVVLTQRNKRWAEERGMKAKVVWPGVDFDKFYAPSKRAISPRKPFTLLGVGAFNRYRRYDDIIGAAAILRKEGHDARVLLVCKDIWDARHDREEILALTKKLGMELYVTFRFDGASEEELPRIYRESDVFLVPIYLPPPRNGYPWSMVIFEAMAAGTPAMVCSTNDVTEVLADGKNAVFFRPTDAADIAEKMGFLIDHPQAYAAIASAGQEFVRKNLTWEKYAEEMLKVFQGT